MCLGSYSGKKSFLSLQEFYVLPYVIFYADLAQLKNTEINPRCIKT
jgi:hypothetical protein